jgi:lysyl-tRNA synthetase class 2
MDSLQPVFIREEVIRSIRTFFEQKKFHEVITPSMNAALPLEPNLYAFPTQWKTSLKTEQLYLSTSPESGLKKMLAKGIGNCFAISKSFRNLEGQGSQHTPEFLMLEWYRENSDYKEMMEDTKELLLYIKQRVDLLLKREKTSEITYQGKTCSLSGNWPIFSMKELFKKYAGLDLEEILTDEVLFNKARKKGYSVENAAWPELFDQILVNEVEPALPFSPFFITDFPARISPLCTPQKENPDFADRFELYLFGMELGNGNTENTDSDSVRQQFLKEKKYREEKSLFSPPIDEEFLSALRTMAAKTYGGIGMGVDRIAMIMANCKNISDVELFYQT